MNTQTSQYYSDLRDGICKGCGEKTCVVQGDGRCPDCIDEQVEMQYFIEIEEKQKSHTSASKFSVKMELGDLYGFGDSVEQALLQLKQRVNLEIRRLQKQKYTRLIRISPEVEEKKSPV